jgi:outer membrane protein OmpA-like peptidoglycan-associated protein
VSGTPPVPDESATPASPSAADSAAELAALRALLLREDRARLDDIESRLAAMDLTAEELAERLPEAIALRARQDRQLGVALAATVENAISESVRRRPSEFADAIFPVLGPAIRKAIAETMAELVGSINRAMEHSFSVRGLKWRLEAWRSGVPYAQVVLRHALVYRVEQVFLVHARTGLLLAEASPPDLAVPDADLVSGMLTAIRDFVGDSFSHDAAAGGLRTFSVGELTVMVEPGPDALLAAVVRGQPAEGFRRKTQETIEAVHALFSSALDDFEGDNTPFEAAKPMLKDCLVTVLETDAPQGAKVNWRPVAVAAALLLIAFVAWRLNAAWRWNRVVAALEATPGLIVVQADRGWRGGTIRGLRDPDATPPAVTIAEAGGDTTRIVRRWETYTSLAPEMTLARARRTLGAASEPLVREIGDARVLFAMGSAQPGAPGSTSLVTLAARLAELQVQVREVGGAVELHLSGRTDGTGSDATNAALSQQRADAVRDLLAPSVPGVRIVTTALGSTAPLEAADDAARARLNRSVSFEVRLLLNPPARSRPE